MGLGHMGFKRPPRGALGQGPWGWAWGPKSPYIHVEIGLFGAWEGPIWGLPGPIYGPSWEGPSGRASGRLG